MIRGDERVTISHGLSTINISINQIRPVMGTIVVVIIW